MSGGVLGHTCTCGHPDLWHREPPAPVRDRNRCERGRCGAADCACQSPSWPDDRPVIHPAYDSTTGHRITHVIPPGSAEYGLRSCGCDPCCDLYTRWLDTVAGDR